MPQVQPRHYWGAYRHRCLLRAPAHYPIHWRDIALVIDNCRSCGRTMSGFCFSAGPAGWPVAGGVARPSAAGAQRTQALASGVGGASVRYRYESLCQLSLIGLSCKSRLMATSRGRGRGQWSRREAGESRCEGPPPSSMNHQRPVPVAGADLLHAGQACQRGEYSRVLQAERAAFATRSVNVAPWRIMYAVAWQHFRGPRDGGASSDQILQTNKPVTATRACQRGWELGLWAETVTAHWASGGADDTEAGRGGPRGGRDTLGQHRSNARAASQY